jgi:hypothetical protein
MPEPFAFLQNKYTRWYFNIISNAQNRDIVGYIEKHHIFPKSLGGSNHKDNLVKLTAREHFICHWLLTKMVIETKHRYQMWNAFSCMLYRKRSDQTRYKVTGQIFENIKKEGAKIKSIKFSGENNPMYGKIHSNEARVKMGISHLGQKRSKETCKNISLSRLGKSKTESHKNSLKKSWSENRESRSGKNHPGYGKPLDDSIKEKIRQSVLNKPLHTCEHCGKTTTKGNYRRWHSDNCKVILGVN